MIKYRKILSVFTVFVLLFISAFGPLNIKTSAADIDIVHIFGTDVNVRSGKSVTSDSLCKINHDVAELLSDEGEWLKIKYKGIEGYVKYDTGWIRKLKYNPDFRDSQFESQISSFPESYKGYLRLLHFLYPNWKFIPYEIDITLSQAVDMETNPKYQNYKKVQENTQPISWRSLGTGAYDWSSDQWILDNDLWIYASREIVSYYMEPRNFLNPYAIYMFLEQKYDPNKQNVEGIKNIIKGTFLDKPYTDSEYPNGDGSYINAILNAAVASDVSPYIIASKIIQEQGTCTDGSLPNLISGTYPGYENLYNFFNIKATGNSTVNGLSHARKEGWTTRAKSIEGGAKFLGNDYISAGQSTYYFQNFDMTSYNNGLHQYAEGIHDSYNKGAKISSAYGDKFDWGLEFTIPIYKNTTDYISPMPEKSDKLNNYYVLSIDGLTPTFNMYDFNYSLSVDSDTALDVLIHEGAALTSTNEFHLGAGNNNIVLTVKSETGYTNDYNISVNAANNCTLFINTIIKTKASSPTNYKLGDVNNDGKITISDIGNIRLHLLNKYTLKDNAALAADVNRDNKITISDIGNIRLHLLGRYTIK